MTCSMVQSNAVRRGVPSLKRIQKDWKNVKGERIGTLKGLPRWKDWKIERFGRLKRLED